MGEPDRGERVGGGERRVAEGVYARQGSRGATLRIAFTYRGVPCREPLRLPPTPANIAYAVRRRGEVINAIERQTFNYLDFFPESKLAGRFGSVPSDLTVGNGIRTWFSKVSLAESTRLTYSRAIDGYLLPWFEHVRERDLTTEMIRERILELADPGRKPRVTLKTAQNILTPLGTYLTIQAEDGKIEANPMDRLGLKRRWPKDLRTSDFEADPFTFAEMEAIFRACDEDEADYWRFAFGTGMRPSEQIEIQWPRVDLVGNRVRVEVARVTGADGASIKDPKTLAGRRNIDLTAGAWEALQRQQARTRLAGKHVWLDARYNKPWRNEEALRKRWGTILKRAGVRYRNPYQTRHTFGSTLLAIGCQPLFVAEQMGHEGTDMLDRHYARFIRQGTDPATRAALVAFFSHFNPKVLAEARIVGASR